MTNRRTALAYALCAGLGPAGLTSLTACTTADGLLVSGTEPAVGGALQPYRDEDALMAALGRWRAGAEKLGGMRRRDGGVTTLSAPMVSMAAAPSALSLAPPSAGPAPSSESGSEAAASITNVQTAGVDEGGIVKQAGDFLIILRRGRLFTVRVGGDALQPVAVVDAYAPDADPQGAWYDELLVSGDTVVVIGYSDARGGTEIGLFALAPSGALTYRATYHLRSFDYFASRNYASRLIGRRLIFYTPTLVQPWGPPPAEIMPGMRRWQGAATPARFERILPATRVYRTDDEFDPGQALALHTITICDLAGAAMRCESTAVLGPAGRVYYVAQGAVYVWTHPTPRRPVGPVPRPVPPASPQSAVFRIPLDGSAPTALKTAGVPIDQLSFLEDASGYLNVLLREAGRGEGMWGSESTQGDMALLRVPVAAFGDGRSAARREHYRRLPAPAGDTVQNRFVGDWLLWSAQARAQRHAPSATASDAAWAMPYAGTLEPIRLSPGHAVERIEAMGRDAVLVGSAGGDLHFSSVRLMRDGAVLAGRHVRTGASQGESRTHGFFYRASGAAGGLLGLPILEPAKTRPTGVFRGAQGAAAVLFLRQHDLAFQPLGELRSNAQAVRDDACKASCVDWYGNARPIFLGARVFGLLGYELVEGTLAGSGPAERLAERRRVSFAPAAPGADGRYSPFN